MTTMIPRVWCVKPPGGEVVTGPESWTMRAQGELGRGTAQVPSIIREVRVTRAGGQVVRERTPLETAREEVGPHARSHVRFGPHSRSHAPVHVRWGQAGVVLLVVGELLLEGVMVLA